MTDMSQFIAPKSDQLNADDLIAGPRTITVTRVTAQPDAAEQPVSIHFEGDNGKPFKPCKSMRRVLVAVWGADSSKYPGRSMTLYRDPSVKFGGIEVGGIRISHATHIDGPQTMALTASRAQRKPYTVQPLQIAPKASDEQVRQIHEEARGEARKGKTAFIAWWKANKGDRQTVAGQIITELQQIATEADAAPGDDDPFDQRPTPEQLAEAEKAAIEHAERAAKEQEGAQE